MRIDCPACEAAYDVPEALLPPGRETRCLRCGHAWTPRPAPVVAPPATPPPRPIAPPRPGLPALRSAPPPRQRGWTGVLLAWLLSLGLLAGAAWAAWTWQEQVIRAWPPAERAFAGIRGMIEK